MYKKYFKLMIFAVALLSLSAGLSAGETTDKTPADSLWVGILIQDDVTAGVSTDLEAYRDFIRRLPPETRVMIGYARVGSNEIRQTFTDDLTLAAQRIRTPSGVPSTAPGSPYQALKEFVKQFPESPGKKHVIFVSDGVDHYASLNSSPTNNPILTSAVRTANKLGVEIHTIFAPTADSAGSRSVAFSGQDSLNYLTDETDGRSFANGTTYVSAGAFLDKIQQAITQ